VQSKVQYLKSLQLGRIDLTEKKTSQSLKKLLVRFKHLKKFRNEPEIGPSELDDIYKYFANLRLTHRDPLNRLNPARFEKKIPLIFYSKNKIPQKAQRLILCIRKQLSSIVSVEEDQDLFWFAVNICFSRGTDDFDKGMFEFVRRFKKRYSLDYATLTHQSKQLLHLFEINGFNVISQLDLETILEKRISFERFLSRKDARVILEPSFQYSWETLMRMLDFSQQIF